VDAKWQKEIRDTLPELPEARRKRMVAEYSITEQDAQVLTLTKSLADQFEAAAKAAKQQAAAPAANAAPEVLEVVVTEIVDGYTLYMQVLGTGTQQLEQMMQRLRQEPLATSAVPSSVKRGDVVCAQFTVDETWYRAQVEDVFNDNEISVRYIDYGNAELLPRSRLRTLPAGYSAQTLPFQAHLARLAYLMCPAIDDDLGVDAAKKLRDLAFGRVLMAQVEARADGALHVVLGDPATNVNVNATMLRAGLSTLVSRRNRVAIPNAALLEKLEADEKVAHVTHAGLWANGDVGNEDDF